MAVRLSFSSLELFKEQIFPDKQFFLYSLSQKPTETTLPSVQPKSSLWTAEFLEFRVLVPFYYLPTIDSAL